MKAIRVNKYLVPVLAVVTLLGSVWVAKAAGVWQTSGRGQVLLDEGGQADPQGIKGWMTLNDVSETYGVPLEALYCMIGASPDIPPDTALKDLEKLVPGMEVWALREAVAAYQDGSWTPEDGRCEDEAIEEAPQPAPMPTPTPQPAPTRPSTFPREPERAEERVRAKGFRCPRTAAAWRALRSRGG